MSRNPRCLYDNSFQAFLHDTEMSVLGVLHNNYHGDTRTTTTEAWKEEIAIMREVVSSFETDGRIIFEYDIENCLADSYYFSHRFCILCCKDNKKSKKEKK